MFCVLGGNSDLEAGGDSGSGSGDVECVKFDVMEGETRRGGGVCDCKKMSMVMLMRIVIHVHMWSHVLIGILSLPEMEPFSAVMVVVICEDMWEESEGDAIRIYSLGILISKVVRIYIFVLYTDRTTFK